MAKHTSKDTIASILADAPTMTISQLHEKYGVKPITIRAILRRNNVSHLSSNNSITKEKLVEVLKDGWLSSQELSSRLGRSYPTIVRAMKIHGIVRERKPSVRQRFKCGNRAFKILGYIMANPEMSLSVVAKQFLCTREFVSQVEAMARQEGIIK